MDQPRVGWRSLVGIGCLVAMSALASAIALDELPRADDQRAAQRDPAGAPAAQALETVRGSLIVGPLASRPGRIELPYVHYRRPGAARPTVFFLGGGPGISNLKFVPHAEWLRDFDVVVLEYRGVGRSSIQLGSGHFARGLRKLRGRLDSADAAIMKADFAAGFADLRRQGIVFDEFSVEALADDLELLRRALDLPSVYLVGHSFGTRVALSYQTRYRASVAASLLFAMNTPGGFIWQPSQTQAVLQRYQAYLARSDPARAAGLARLLAAPQPRPKHYGPFSLNDAKALFVTFFLSFNTWTRDHAYQALIRANEGAGGQWLLMEQSYDWFIRFGFNWADFFLKAYTADCDREAIRRADAQGAGASFQSPSSVLFAGMDGYEAAGGRCQPAAWTPDLRHTLAINGEFDTTTPLERRPAGMGNDQYIVIAGGGHADVFYPDHGRVAGWMRDFFLRPSHRQPPPAADAAAASGTSAAPPLF